MNYLQNYHDTGTLNSKVLNNLFQKNLVTSVLKAYGYYTISTASGFDFTSLRTDMKFSPAFSLNEFESTVLSLTPVPPLMNNATLKGFISEHASFFDLHEAHRNRMLSAFSILNSIEKPLHRPVFVFAHIMLAHPPFVFDEKGHPTADNSVFSLGQPTYSGSDTDYQQQYATAYRKQVMFGNRLLLHTIDKIISQDDRKKVIIIQGDHGPYSMPLIGISSPSVYKERMPILNAYYFSDGGPEASLYEHISPVNSFRLVFNHYLNKNYTILEDRAYFTASSDGFDFLDVTDFLE
jgi:hypothetical protein